jgi:sugar lactone lactonase YvrE
MLIGATVLGCAAGERPAASEPISVSDVGLETPESVLHDQVADVYLVSNINGTARAKDDNGFIARIAPDGTVLDLKWIDGENPEITLHAPKGLAIRGDTLFVADIDAVRLFNRQTGEPSGTWSVPGATSLNDVAVGRTGKIYVTDSGMRAGRREPTSGTDAVVQFDEAGTPERLVSGAALGGPNGIAVDRAGRIVIVSYVSGQVTLVSAESGQISGLPAPEAGGLDGVALAPDGSYLISSWEGNAVYRMGPGGQYSVEVSDVDSPADIAVDRGRRRLLIPLPVKDRLEIRPLN